MDISCLPEELFEEIASYLQLEDILSCCLVNSRWREAINTNRIWFSLCSKRCPVNINNFELIESPCLVNPAFKPPQHTSDTLSEVCPWRLRFMQEAHISRNWRYGRCVPLVITKAINPLYVECDEDALLISSIEKREFTSWSINQKPALKQTVQFSLWHVLSAFFKLCGGKLVIVQCTLLQVFTKNENDKSMFDLSHRFLFNKPEEESFNIPLTPDVSDWYNNNIGLYPSDINVNCDHNGDYFVGLVEEMKLNKVVFHIWDINSGHKVAEQKIPETEEIVRDIHFSLHSSNLFVLLKVADSLRERTIIYCFNLNTFQYTNLNLSFHYVVPIVLFGDKFLLNTDDSGKTLWIWRNEGGSFVHKIGCDFDIHPASLQIVLPFVIFAGNAGNTGTVKVFNVDRLQTECEFVTDYRVTNMLFIRAGLLLVCGFSQSGLWDITSSTKIHTLDFNDCLWANDCKTKTVVESDDELYLLHYW